MSIWIAGFLGPIFLVLALRMIISPSSLLETSRKFLADSPLVLISGVLAMVAGLSIVNTHNLWVWDWRLIVTLFGWMLVIGGAIRVVAPVLVNLVGGAMMERPGLTRVAGMVWALLGVLLVFKGYVS
jgi:hypothetical protein